MLKECPLVPMCSWSSTRDKDFKSSASLNQGLNQEVILGTDLQARFLHAKPKRHTTPGLNPKDHDPKWTDVVQQSLVVVLQLHLNPKHLRRMLETNWAYGYSPNAPSANKVFDPKEAKAKIGSYLETNDVVYGLTGNLTLRGRKCCRRRSRAKPTQRGN